MTFEEEHVLLWTVNKHRCGFCFKESVTHSTDHARCACQGWECWAKTKTEITAAHQHHLKYFQEHKKQLSTTTSIPEVNLHDLRWDVGAGHLIGYCKGCSWRLYGRPRKVIAEAYAAHLMNPSGYKTY